MRSFKATLVSKNQTWGSSVFDMYCRSVGKPAFRRDSPSSSCRCASTVEVCQILESPCQIYLRMNPETGVAVEKSGREWAQLQGTIQGTVMVFMWQNTAEQPVQLSRREARCCNDARPTSYCTSSLVLSTSFGSFTRPLLATVSISYG